jgi:hypothetical protein
MSRRSLAEPGLVEQYIRGQIMPRYMQRLREIEDELRVHTMRLAHAYSELQRLCGHDPATFEARWRTTARAWPFDRVNELIHQHNEYYPVERRLPISPRTGEYLTVGGRPWRREPAGAAWILERFPARPQTSDSDIRVDPEA